MEIMIKLKRELVDENITDLFTGLETSIYEHSNWFTLKVFYEEANVNQLSSHLDALFKVYFQQCERIGMRINDMPYVATSDNKNVKAIMQKLLK